MPFKFVLPGMLFYYCSKLGMMLPYLFQFPHGTTKTKRTISVRFVI